MSMFYSPLEQFEICSYTTYPTTWTTSFIDLYQNNFFFSNHLWTTSESFLGNSIWFLFVFFIVKILSSMIKGHNIFFNFFFMLAFLSSIYILSFKDYALNTYEILLNDDQTIRLIIERTDLVAIADSLVVFYNITLAFISISILLYVIHLETTSDSLLKIIPTFNNVIGEMIYKATFLLFTSILGKNISNKEFFIQINTIFFFLIISNLQGMIPYMFTLTSALTNTFFIALALFISILITILDKKGMNYFLNLFMPPGCPIALIFLLIPIEVISYSFRVVSLSVRLFANMMAGHTLLKVIVGFSWVMIYLGDSMIIANLFPILTLFILTLLEIGVALIQAYIFTILSCIYIRDIFEGH